MSASFCVTSLVKSSSLALTSFCVSTASEMIFANLSSSSVRVLFAFFMKRDNFCVATKRSLLFRSSFAVARVRRSFVVASSILRSSMHASHARLSGPGCSGQSLAAGVFPSVLSPKLPALLADDAMLSLVVDKAKPLSFRSVSGLDDVQSLVVVHLSFDLFGLSRRVIS